MAGCLAQRYKEEIQTEIPEVDEILGTMAIDAVTAAIDEVSAGEKHNHITDPDAALVYGKHRSVTTGGHFAYLKIAEGCDKRCTYCIIQRCGAITAASPWKCWKRKRGNWLRAALRS